MTDTTKLSTPPLIEPCGNADCDKCDRRPRWKISQHRIQHLTHVLKVKAATEEEALGIYDAGTAWPSAYDDRAGEVVQLDPVQIECVLPDKYHLTECCWHDLLDREDGSSSGQAGDLHASDGKVVQSAELPEEPNLAPCESMLADVSHDRAEQVRAVVYDAVVDELSPTWAGKFVKAVTDKTANAVADRVLAQLVQDPLHARIVELVAGLREACDLIDDLHLPDPGFRAKSLRLRALVAVRADPQTDKGG